MNRFVPNSQVYTSLKADLLFCWSDTEDVLLAAVPVEAHLTFLTQRITIPLTFIIEFIYEPSPYKNNSIIRVHCCQLLGKPAIRLSQRERFTRTITKAATHTSSSHFLSAQVIDRSPRVTCCRASQSRVKVTGEGVGLISLSLLFH